MFSGGAHGWNIDIAATRTCLVLVRPALVGKERIEQARVAGARCWVLKDRVIALAVDDSSGLRSGRAEARAGAAWGSTARTLRTTQWTRAS